MAKQTKKIHVEEIPIKHALSRAHKVIAAFEPSKGAYLQNNGWEIAGSWGEDRGEVTRERFLLFFIKP